MIEFPLLNGIGCSSSFEETEMRWKSLPKAICVSFQFFSSFNFPLILIVDFPLFLVFFPFVVTQLIFMFSVSSVVCVCVVFFHVWWKNNQAKQHMFEIENGLRLDTNNEEIFQQYKIQLWVYKKLISNKMAQNISQINI